MLSCHRHEQFPAVEEDLSWPSLLAAFLLHSKATNAISSSPSTSSSSSLSPRITLFQEEEMFCKEALEEMRVFFDIYPFYLPFCTEEVMRANLIAFAFPGLPLAVQLQEIQQNTGGYPRSPILLPMQINKLQLIYELSQALQQWMHPFNTKFAGETPLKASLVPFGSFLMDGGFVDSDLNLLLLLPEPITWLEMTTSFLQFLGQQTQFGCLNIANLHILHDAFVPAIKFTANGIAVDLVMAHLQGYRDVTKADIYAPDIANHLNTKSLRALNGLRNCRAILDMVPDIFIFCHCLQVVKVWATSQGIYSALTGYLGGISWAILLLRVHQAHPKSSAMGLVYSFFYEYAHWDWSHPVQVYDDPASSPKKEALLPPPAATSHRPMCILSPVAPVQNTAFNTTVSGAAIIRRQFQDAIQLMGNISRMGDGWNSLLEPIHFRAMYSHYLVVAMHRNLLLRSGNSTSQPNNLSKEWTEFRHLVESRLRLLVVMLDSSVVESNTQREGYWLFRLFPQSFVSQSGETLFWLIGLPGGYRRSRHAVPLGVLHSYFVQQVRLKMPPPSLQLLNALQVRYMSRKDLARWEKA